MSSTSEPMHLSNHHRNTLRQIFQHPVSHNVEWHAVVSLLEAVGSVVKHSETRRRRRMSTSRRLWTCAGC